MLPLLAWGVHDRGHDVIVGLTLSARSSDEMRARLREILGAFSDLAKIGMFACSEGAEFEPGVDPAAYATVQVGAPDLAQSWLVRCRHLEAGAFRLLVNALMNGLSQPSGMLGLSIQSTTAGPPIEIHVRSLREIPYPTACNPLPFALDDQLTDPLRREVVVRVEFREPLTDDVLHHMGRGLRYWERVISFGAFVDSALDLRVLSPPVMHAEWYRVSEHSAEYALFSSNLPIESINLIICLMVNVHRFLAPIAAAELE